MALSQQHEVGGRGRMRYIDWQRQRLRENNTSTQKEGEVV